MSLVQVVTLAFTLIALLAVYLHLKYLQELILDRRAIRDQGTNGKLLRLANNFVQVEATRLLINVVVAIVGLGSLGGLRPIGWLLAGIPIISVTASWLNFRGRR